MLRGQPCGCIRLFYVGLARPCWLQVLATGLGTYSAGSTPLNVVNPPLRDTVTVPQGGWAVLRFVVSWLAWGLWGSRQAGSTARLVALLTQLAGG